MSSGARWLDPLGLYHPGRTWVHRAPASAKLLALAALGVALVVLRGPWPALAALALAVTLAASARLPWRSTLRGITPVLITAVMVAAYQTWQRDAALGVEVGADLLTLVVAAGVATATTRADVLLEEMVRAAGPLRHVGLPPTSVALAVSLMLRSVPAIGEVLTQSLDAARARGMERSPRAVVVPAAIRTVARARATGEALAARGLGD